MFKRPVELRESYYVDNLIMSSGMVEVHKDINCFLNFALAIVTYLISHNLIVCTLAFVAYDIVSIFIESVVISLFTKDKDSLTLEEMEKVYEKSCKESEKLLKRLQEACPHCSSYISYCSIPPNRCRSAKCSIARKFFLAEDRKNYYGPIIKAKKEEIAKQQKELEKQQTVSKNVKSQNYENKMQYFEDIKTKVSYYEEHGITILKPIQTAVAQLVDVLTKKPDGLSFVPSRTYLYLDELMSIMGKYMGLEEDRKDVYEQQILQIADILSKDINSMVDRIQNSEETDIDISIAVLMNELKTRDKEDEDV